MKIGRKYYNINIMNKIMKRKCNEKIYVAFTREE